MKILAVSISAPPKNTPESIQTGRFLTYLSAMHQIDLLTSESQGGWDPIDENFYKYTEGINKVFEIGPSNRFIQKLKNRFIRDYDYYNFFYQS